MRNPLRRNRNIGTPKQGQGRNNRMLIPRQVVAERYFYEQLGSYRRWEQRIGGEEMTFVVEETRPEVSHACSVADIRQLLQWIDPNVLAELSFVVLRQPTRKQELLSPVWGRLIYSFLLEGESGPAVILEAVSPDRPIKWPKKQAPDDQKEFERLQADGHVFVENKRHFICEPNPAAVRRTQLYRTLPHEIGHLVHYLEQVAWRYEANPTQDYLALWETYEAIPHQEKEQFAHRYAEELQRKLAEAGKVPFPPQPDPEEIA